MSILSDSGERTGEAVPPCPTDPATARGGPAPGWVLARRWTQLASPAIVALVAYAVRRLS